MYFSPSRVGAVALVALALSIPSSVEAQAASDDKLRLYGDVRLRVESDGIPGNPTGHSGVTATGFGHVSGSGSNTSRMRTSRLAGACGPDLGCRSNRRTSPSGATFNRRS